MEKDTEDATTFRALDAGDIALLKTYGQGPYNTRIGLAEDDIKKLNRRINETVGIKESDTGLAPPSQVRTHSSGHAAPYASAVHPLPPSPISPHLCTGRIRSALPLHSSNPKPLLHNPPPSSHHTSSSGCSSGGGSGGGGGPPP